jgi:phage protein D
MPKLVVKAFGENRISVSGAIEIEIDDAQEEGNYLLVSDGTVIEIRLGYRGYWRMECLHYGNSIVNLHDMVGEGGDDSITLYAPSYTWALITPVKPAFVGEYHA